jgi:hypothetical protein
MNNSDAEYKCSFCNRSASIMRCDEPPTWFCDDCWIAELRQRPVTLTFIGDSLWLETDEAAS